MLRGLSDPMKCCRKDVLRVSAESKFTWTPLKYLKNSSIFTTKLEKDGWPKVK